uniref:Uncharacterized protein n=1 Tax=Tetranychus urticae TaxID=32264 RepID=T1JUS7_TETUR
MDDDGNELDGFDDVVNVVGAVVAVAVAVAVEQHLLVIAVVELLSDYLVVDLIQC